MTDDTLLKRQDDAISNQSLAIAIARLTVLVESSEKARNEDTAERRIMKHDIGNILTALQGIDLLRLQITSLSTSLSSGLSDSAAQSAKSIADVAAALTEKISANSKELATVTADVEQLKSWRDRLDGASGAYTKIAGWIWALVGSMGGLLFAGVGYFIQHHSGGAIGGE